MEVGCLGHSFFQRPCQIYFGLRYLSGWFICITKQNEHIQSIIVFIQFFQNFVKKIAFNLKMTISTNFFKEEFEVIEGLAF